MNGKIKGGNEVEGMIKLVACDLDGTLLDEKHELPRENAEAILKLQKAGIEFMSATGRNYRSVKKLFSVQDIQCDHLLLNGAMRKDKDGNTLYEKVMDLAVVEQIIAILSKEDLCFNMYTSEGTVTPDIKKAQQEFLVHMKQNGMREEEAKEMMEKNSFCIYEREVSDLAAYLKEAPRIYKMETFGGTREVAQRVRKKLTMLSGIALSDSISDNVEITDLHAQKGYTLRLLCEQKNIALDEVVVMGDSMNDLSMMQLFQHSVAMGNATQAIKDAATYVTKENHEFAVAHVIEQILAYSKKEVFSF